MFEAKTFGDVAWNISTEYYKNKLPLGGVKAPFNLSSEKDIYTDPTEINFHCYVFTEKQKLKKVLEWFSEKFGDFDHQLVYGDTIEFFFNLLSETEIKRLSLELETFGGRKICKNPKNSFFFLDEDTDLGAQFLIQDMQSYQKSINHMASGLSSLEMNSFLEEK